MRELLGALDAMPKKELISNSLEAEGQFCALGAVAHSRGSDLSAIGVSDPEYWHEGDWNALSNEFNIADALVREVMWMNDDYMGWTRKGTNVSAKRWLIVRNWAARELGLPEISKIWIEFYQLFAPMEVIE